MVKNKRFSEWERVSETPDLEAISDERIQVTIRIPKSIVDQFKREAAEIGGKYQSLMVKVLKDYLTGCKNSLDKLSRRVERLEKALKVASK